MVIKVPTLSNQRCLSRFLAGIAVVGTEDLLWKSLTPELIREIISIGEIKMGA